MPDFLLYAFSLTATVTAFLGYLLYIKSIYTGNTAPSKMTWAILSGLSVLVAIANFELEATFTLGTLLVSAVCSVIIFLLSLKKGVGGWDFNDKVALGGLGISLVLWLVLMNPLYSLLLALTFDFWALYPTIMKIRLTPSSEEPFPWLMTVIASIFNLLAANPFTLNDVTFSIIITPAYLAVINSIVLFFILKPHLKRRLV